MADNVTASAAVGTGAVFASKDIAGVQYPRNILTTPAGVDVIPLAEGGAVSVSNFPVSYPVTGTFWQATQPVSGAVAVNVISGFATEATLAARIPVNGQALMAASVPVTLASNQSALPVTGTFWQTTQPVSLTSTTITGTVAATQSGTWNIGSITTLPALATGANVIGALTANQSVNCAQVAGVAMSTGNGVTGTGVQRVTIASDNTAFTVNATPPALTKGTQGANGNTVQQLRDAGRNSRAFMLDAYVAAPVAEALQTVVQWYSNAAVAGTTQPAVVPANKILRLTNWAISTKSLATVGSAVLRIRANTAGLVVIGSPLVWSAEVGSKSGATTVAMTGGLDTITGVFPEGFEFPAGTGLGFTLAGYGPTGTLTLQGVTRFQVYGYEY